LEHHEEKTKANIDILRAEAAKAYWENHNYDLVNAKFYDDDKEKSFVAERSEKAKTHG